MKLAQSRHCERSEAIQEVHTLTFWIASLLTFLAMTVYICHAALWKYAMTSSESIGERLHG